MEVEVEGEDGSKSAVGKDEKTVFGRGCGFNTHDRTVSRRHVSFQLDHSDSDVARVSFQVMGKNPFWVFNGEELRLFRKFDKGHLQFGHRFCFSPNSNTPLWFTLNNINIQPHPRLNLNEIHISDIDPVKEFGFVVMGHEFDHYPKGVIRDARDWEWFLEEPRNRKDSEDEEDVEKERRKMRGKRKMGKVNEDDDDEWAGESEDDKDLVANMRKGKLPRYSTRSKHSKGGGIKDTKAIKNFKQKKAPSVGETSEEGDDETLGGFIVADEGDDKDEENHEEEEFEDDDDELDD